jgi:hypothetical protein
MQPVEAHSNTIPDGGPASQSRLIWLDRVIVGVYFGTYESAVKSSEAYLGTLD